MQLTGFCEAQRNKIPVQRFVSVIYFDLSIDFNYEYSIYYIPWLGN